MKTQKAILKSGLSFVLVAIILIVNSCKKDDSNEDNTPSISQRVVQMHEIEGDIDKYKNEFKYEEGRMTEQVYSRFYEEYGWVKKARHTFEYLSEDLIHEYRETGHDTIWNLMVWYEKKFSGNVISELIMNRYNSDYGIWEPSFKVTYSYQSGLLLESNSYDYEDNMWEVKSNIRYLYEGNNWIRRYITGFDGIQWDTIARYEAIYSGNRLSEVNGHTYSNGTWYYSEQYVLNYNDGRISEMIINDIYGDIIRWDYSILFEYNEYGNPSKYTLEYDDHPDEVTYITYENEVGNFRKAKAANSGFDVYPWLPAPVKKSVSPTLIPILNQRGGF